MAESRVKGYFSLSPEGKDVRIDSDRNGNGKSCVSIVVYINGQMRDRDKDGCGSAKTRSLYVTITLRTPCEMVHYLAGLGSRGSVGKEHEDWGLLRECEQPRQGLESIRQRHVNTSDNDNLAAWT